METTEGMDSLGHESLVFFHSLEEIVWLLSGSLHSVSASKREITTSKQCFFLRAFFYGGYIGCYPAVIPLGTAVLKTPIVQAQIINCNVYFKCKNKISEHAKQFAKKRERAGEPGPMHNTMACPHAGAGDMGQALRGHLAQKALGGVLVQVSQVKSIATGISAV